MVFVFKNMISMRKYELIFAFILALILMFLASCRSKEVVMNEQVDSVAVRAFSLADIRSKMLDFSFDSMCFEVDDTCQSVKAKSYRVKVMGGKIRAESLESRAESSEKKDSVAVKSEYHEEKTIASQKGLCRWWLILIAIGGVLAIVIIIIFRKMCGHWN